MYVSIHTWQGNTSLLHSQWKEGIRKPVSTKSLATILLYIGKSLLNLSIGLIWWDLKVFIILTSWPCNEDFLPNSVSFQQFVIMRENTLILDIDFLSEIMLEENLRWLHISFEESWLTNISTFVCYLSWEKVTTRLYRWALCEHLIPPCQPCVICTGWSIETVNYKL